MSLPESRGENLSLPFPIALVPHRTLSEPPSAVPLELRLFHQHLLDEGYAPRTVGVYATHLRRWTMRLGRPAAEASPGELREYLMELATRARPSTLGQVRSALRIHYEAVIPCRSLAEVVRGVRPRSGRPARSVGDAQLGRAIRATRSSRERLFVVLLAQGGLRTGELLGLRVRDIDLATRSLRVAASCGHIHRVVPFPPGLRLDLADEMRGRFPHQWLFPGAGGPGAGPLTPRTLQKTLARLSGRAGISPPLSPRVLRRTFARNLVRRGVDREELARQLGLRGSAGVQRYLDEERGREP